MNTAVSIANDIAMVVTNNEIYAFNVTIEYVIWNVSLSQF